MLRRRWLIPVPYRNTRRRWQPTRVMPATISRKRIPPRQPSQSLHHSLHETISSGGNSAGRGVFCNSARRCCGSRRHADARSSTCQTAQWLLPAYVVHGPIYPIGSLLFASGDCLCQPPHLAPLRTEPQVVPRRSESGEGGPTSTVGKVLLGGRVPV